MKVNTKKATGRVLDYLAAKAVGDLAEQGGQVHVVNGALRYYEDTLDEPYSPSTNWSQGGPICEMKGIFPFLASLKREEGKIVFNKSYGAKTPTMLFWLEHPVYADEPLVAAMRCLAASTFGDEAEVPDELC